MRHYLKVDQDIGWTGEIICRRQVFKLVREMESKDINMAGTMIAKDQFTDSR